MTTATMMMTTSGAMTMFSKRNRLVAGGVLALAAAGISAGCSNQLNDLGGVGQAKPDYSLTYLNVKNFPNVTVLCIRGVGFATTTRDYASVMRVPEWDSFCATQEPASPRAAPSPSQS
jgi:hypothetical protein